MVAPEEERDTFSNAERQAIAEADEWLRHNQPIPYEEVLAEFGLTMDDGQGRCPRDRAAHRLADPANAATKQLRRIEPPLIRLRIFFGDRGAYWRFPACSIARKPTVEPPATPTAPAAPKRSNLLFSE